MPFHWEILRMGTTQGNLAVWHSPASAARNITRCGTFRHRVKTLGPRSNGPHSPSALFSCFVEDSIRPRGTGGGYATDRTTPGALRRIKSTRAASRMSAISKLRALIANGKSGAAMRPTKRGHLFKLLWDLEVAQCEYVAAMRGFSEAVKRCSAIGPSDPDTLQTSTHSGSC
jgi:hypothetical protein